MNMKREYDYVLMVGDRKYDIEEARYCGLASIGVAYGYGSREELSEAGADTVVGTVGELKQRLLNIENRKSSL